MAAATLDDLMREIEKARTINAILAQRNREEEERLLWLAQRFTEIGELLSTANDKAKEAKTRLK